MTARVLALSRRLHEVKALMPGPRCLDDQLFAELIAPTPPCFDMRVVVRSEGDLELLQDLVVAPVLREEVLGLPPGLRAGGDDEELASTTHPLHPIHDAGIEDESPAVARELPLFLAPLARRGRRCREGRRVADQQIEAVSLALRVQRIEEVADPEIEPLPHEIVERGTAHGVADGGRIEIQTRCLRSTAEQSRQHLDT